MDLAIARGDVSNLTLVRSVTILQLICSSTSSSQQPSSCGHFLPLPHHNTSPAPSPAETWRVSRVSSQRGANTCSCSCQLPPVLTSPSSCPVTVDLRCADSKIDLREILNILKTVSGHTTIPSPKIIQEGN